MCVRYSVLCFKQTTAYDLRISDWSSDVCSSDLPQERPHLSLQRREPWPAVPAAPRRHVGADEIGTGQSRPRPDFQPVRHPEETGHRHGRRHRSGARGRRQSGGDDAPARPPRRHGPGGAHGRPHGTPRAQPPPSRNRPGQLAGVTDLARAAEVNPGAMTRLLDRLEAKGLVARTADPTDRRALNIHLTESGLAIWQDINKCGERVRERALAGMSEEERSVLTQLLERARDNLISTES